MVAPFWTFAAPLALMFPLGMRATKSIWLGGLVVYD
jgi:hypothetical protein